MIYKILLVTEYMKSIVAILIFSVGISDLISDKKTTNDDIIQVITPRRRRTDVKNLIEYIQHTLEHNYTMIVKI